MTRLLFAAAFVLVACGDDGTPPSDTGVDDASTDSSPLDAPLDAGDGDGLTVTVVSGPVAAATAVEDARVYLETPEGLREEATGPSGQVTFPGVDLDVDALVLTVSHDAHVAKTYVGFDRSVIRYHEDRGWPASADMGQMAVSLQRVATVALSGTVENAAAGLSTIFVEPLDGDALEFRGFASLPWTVRISPQTSTTLISWAWVLGPAGFGERGRTWTAEPTFLETAASVDTSDLVLDFSSDVTVAERTIAYVVPSGTPFFDSALPLAALSTVTPRGLIGATVGFPIETTYDDTSGVVTARLGVVDPPAGEASFLILQLEGEGSGQSNVILDWDGPPSAPIDAEFLAPPTLDESTADGIRLGERVRWSASEPDTIQEVTYAVETAPRWDVQYWGRARARGDFPDLPVDAVDAILAVGALTANVSSCEFTPELCRRVSSSRAFDVDR